MKDKDSTRGFVWVSSSSAKKEINRIYKYILYIKPHVYPMGTTLSSNSEI